MGDDARARGSLIAADVGDNDCTVRSDPKLGPVRVADPYPLFEPERGIQPGHGCPHIGVDENR